MVKKSEKKDNALIGMFIHTFEKNGDQFYEDLLLQGEILDVDGDIVLVNVFSWIYGASTHVKPMRKSFIYSNNCRIYATREDMLSAYEKYCEKNK